MTNEPDMKCYEFRVRITERFLIAASAGLSCLLGVFLFGVPLDHALVWWTEPLWTFSGSNYSPEYYWVAACAMGLTFAVAIGLSCFQSWALRNMRFAARLKYAMGLFIVTVISFVWAADQLVKP